MQKLRIAITGAGGFIGSQLADSLRRDDVELVLVTGKYGNVKNFTDAVVADILDLEQMKKCLLNVDVVVHLAGLNSVRESFHDPAETLTVNAVGTSILLSVCKVANISKAIIISSAEVYGRPESNPVTESSALKPLSPYGVSKVTIEQLCYVSHIADNINFKVLRPFSIYGPRMSKKSLIREIYDRLKAGDNVTLFNCSSSRDYCYVDDLAAAINKAIFTDFKGFEVYNIASGTATNSKQLAEAIQSIMGSTGKISENTAPDRPRRADIDYLVADITLATHQLKWLPKTTLQDGLQKTLNFFANE